MDLKQAAINTREYILFSTGDLRLMWSESEEKNCSAGLFHIKEMLDKLQEEKITGEKGNRWLGYIQGVLVCRELMTLEEAKNCNKLA